MIACLFFLRARDLAFLGNRGKNREEERFQGLVHYRREDLGNVSLSAGVVGLAPLLIIALSRMVLWIQVHRQTPPPAANRIPKMTINQPAASHFLIEICQVRRQETKCRRGRHRRRSIYHTVTVTVPEAEMGKTKQAEKQKKELPSFGDEGD